MKTRILNQLLATTIICGAAISAPAFAQDTTDPTAQPGAGPVEGTNPSVSSEGENVNTEQDIVVTGSRIPQPNLTSVSPVTVINSQEVKLQGVTRTEDLINTLPQAFAGQGGNLANGATGTATVNLRNLGPERTLVLINGRRLLVGDPGTGNPAAPDINAIPTGIVKRVDVLTGGASSVYGSDAVAGVVNIIMDTDFEGIRLDGQFSMYTHNNDSENTGIREALNRRGFPYPTGTSTDGETVNLDATFGAGFDDGRGSVVAYAGYRKLEAVTQDNRDYSACASQARTIAQTQADPARRVDCGGSATSGIGSYFTNTGTFQTGPGRTFIPGTTAYNFAPTNYYQRPDERYTLGAFAQYEISEAVEPYLELMFMDDRTIAQIAPSGNFGNTLTINCDNPLLSAQQLAIACAPTNLVGFAAAVPDDPTTPANEASPASPPTVFIDPTTGATYNQGNLQILRRNVEGGPRQDDLQHTMYRIVGGVRGDVNKAISYDAYYMFGRVNFAETYLNDFSVNRLTRAIDVVDGDPGAGVTPVCRTFRSGIDPNCVPYDIFALNSVNPASIQYLQTPGFQRGQTEQNLISANMTFLLGEYGFQLPWANEGVGLNVGYEYRKDKVNLDTDIAFQTGDLAGQGAATLPIEGDISVREFFGETRIPIVTDSFFYNLSFEGGYRYSKYTTDQNSFSTDAYKLALDFSPIRDVRLRASYNRAVRAPNVQELFATQRVALNGNSDPCTGDLDPTTTTAAPEATAAQCALTGVGAAQYGTLQGNPAGQYNGLIGGNPELTPEKATTKSIGVVLQPRFLPGFAATVDYFDIKIDNTIQQIGQDTIIQTCIDTGNPTFCGLIQRDQFASLWRTSNGFVRDLDQNIGGVETKGIDVGLSYAREIGALGGLSFSVVGTYLDELITDNGVSEPYDCAGLFGLQCGIPNPEWRHKARVTYTAPDGVGVSVQWRYFSKVDIDRSSESPTLNGPFSPYNEDIKAQSYLDLAFTFRASDNYTFRLGAQNLLDKEPPIIGANGTSGEINACPSVFCSGNTFPQVYDALGRYIYVGVTLDY
jgi:iron complex outermembrane receptor protein